MGRFGSTRTEATQNAAVLGAGGIGEGLDDRLQSGGPGRWGRYQPLTSAGIRGSVAVAYAAASLRPHAPGIEITADVAVQDMYAFGNALRGYEAAGTAAQRDAAALSNRLAREKQQQRSRFRVKGIAVSPENFGEHITATTTDKLATWRLGGARLVRAGVPTPQLDGTVARLRGFAPVNMDDLGVHPCRARWAAFRVSLLLRPILQSRY